jgi:FKBP-type peptidyl-prolyl cis-trans isomerases 1
MTTLKKTLIALLSITIVVFSFTACNDDNNNDDSEWRDTNEEFYNKLADNKEYQIVSLPGAPDAVYYKVIKSGDPSGIKPYYTSKVKVLYYGYLYDGTTFDSGTKRDEDLYDQDPENYSPPTPYTFTINGLVEGFGIALQNMVPGDRWALWIPWPLGYGSVVNGTIPSYSTLGFEVELVEVTKL